MTKKILIIEDEEYLRDLLATKLGKSGYEVITAEDGEVGMEKIRTEDPDMVLLDIVMPKKNGYQILEEVQADEKLRKIPIMVISNSGQPVEVKRLIELGACDYLVKADFTPEEVAVKMRACMNLR